MANHMIQKLAFFTLAAVLPLASVQAQMGGGDPSEEIKEIARMIDEQLKEIDKLLLESGKKGQSRKKPRELLQQAAENSLTVQDGIEKLIEKLNEMKQQGSKSQSSSSSSSSDQQKRDGQQSQSQSSSGKQEGQQSQGNQQRRENQTPDFVKQEQEGQKPGEQGKPDGKQEQGKDGQQQNQPQGNNQPKGGKETKTAGKNKPGNNPPNSETGPGQPGTGEGGWGELQPYLNFLKNRGSSPKVPEKYRKYYEAYLKSKNKSGKK